MEKIAIVVCLHGDEKYGLKVIENLPETERNPPEEYCFLTEDKKPVKETKIEKTRYTGKIYDADVPNDSFNSFYRPERVFYPALFRLAA